MLIPTSWLTRYVKLSVDPKDLAHQLTMAGVEVESVEQIGMHLDPDLVVVGEIVKLEPHPNADRLQLPTVDLGTGESIKVVCGAPNVAVGQKVAFAKLGARLLNTHSGRDEPLRPAKIRGFESKGMVCSIKELSLGEDNEGILVLDPDAVVGSPLIDLVGDNLLNIAVTPNRPDCLSVLGVAREIAALTRQVITEPEITYVEHGDAVKDQVTVKISDPDLCRRYTASLIQGVTVGPSPPWLQETLVKAGQRPINNVVDVTNFVMMETNQPLHAFDLDLVKDATIIVRRARHGEALDTLDGQNRRLEPQMLVIADSTDAIGLAGVMGGASTEVSENTKRVLLESANFDPVNTRQTSAKLRLSTGASYRFERGLTKDLAEIGLRRATRLIAEICGGTVSTGIIDINPDPDPDPTITLSATRIKQVLGIEVPMPEVEEVLSSLGFGLSAPSRDVERLDESAEPASISVHPPYWRSDITIEDDLVEEIVRMIGYNEIPTTMLAAPIPHHEPQPAWSIKERIKDLLAAAGLREIITYNVSSEPELKAVGTWTENALALSNPMNEEQRYLRTSLRPAMLQTLSQNRRVGRSALRLFEIGRIFMPGASNDANTLPNEKETLIAAFCGKRQIHSWQRASRSEEEPNMDFFDAKGVIMDLLVTLGIEPSFVPAEDPALQAGRTAVVLAGGDRLGIIGEVTSEVLETFDIEGVAGVLAELDLTAVLRASTTTGHRYRPFSRYPESIRDLALTVDEAVTAEEIQAVLSSHKLVKSITPFDLYTGEGVAKGKKSITYELVLQSDKSTLTSGQIDRALEDLLLRLKRTFGAELRA